MIQQHLGEFFALATALSWACSVILFKTVSDTISATLINLCKNLIAFVALLLTLLCFQNMVEEISIRSFIILFLSGVLGIGIADTLFFKSLKEVGAGWMAIVECLYSPSVIFFAGVFLHERLQARALLGGALIVVSLSLPVLSREKLSITPLQAKKGLFFGSLSMIFMAMAITFVKPIIEQHSILMSATIRIFGGLCYLLVQVSLNRHTPLIQSVHTAFKQTGKYLVPAALLGSYLAYFFWIGGFKYTSASKASLLNQTSTIFTIILAYLFLKEPLHRIKVISVSIAILGTLMILL